MKHDLKNPFPIVHKALGAITNEVCTCGHKRTEHSDTFQFGHGNCQERTCACSKFTWKAFEHVPAS